MDLDNYEVLPLEVQKSHSMQMDALERASVDTQVVTAKQYPRNLTKVRNNAIALVTMDENTARSCSYALPRGGKPLTGPSVHLARILAQQFGNLRAESKIVEINEKQVVSRGTAWDLESNYAVSFEVRRSIINKSGARFSDDMIVVTGNAANAISYRNAVLAIIPKGITEAAYNAAQELITGDMSDETKIVARRKKAIEYFNDEFGIKEDEVVKLCGKQTVNQIRSNEIALMLGFQQSLKDGDTTVDELMKPIRGSKEEVKSKKKVIRNKKNKAPDLL